MSADAKHVARSTIYRSFVRNSCILTACSECKAFVQRTMLENRGTCKRVGNPLFLPFMLFTDETGFTREGNTNFGILPSRTDTIPLQHLQRCLLHAWVGIIEDIYTGRDSFFFLKVGWV
jgi:hypothetical protein